MRADYIISFEQLGKALQRFNEALQMPLDKQGIVRDASILRFEFTIELFWKILKKFLQFEKVTTTSPRDTLQQAYSFKWIDNESVWLRMMDDRNLTSHTYKEENAEKIYHNLAEYYPEMEKCYAFLKTKFQLSA